MITARPASASTMLVVALTGVYQEGISSFRIRCISCWSICALPLVPLKLLLKLLPLIAFNSPPQPQHSVIRPATTQVVMRAQFRPLPSKIARITSRMAMTT
jgi:hypothetical protein